MATLLFLTVDAKSLARVMAEKKKAIAEGETLICRNTKAAQRYSIEETLEAGMVLMGSEVKSLRGKAANLDSAYASIDRNELMIHQMQIAPWAHAASFGHEAKRSRKLLVKRHEIEKLRGQLALRGYTLIPTRAYFKNGVAKVELGLCKRKDIGDARQEVREREDKREARAAIQRGIAPKGAAAKGKGGRR